ncbi:uncharacterized protein LOC27208581 [Drosophila simulans]|uniref:uncharacterized protein LOC27208581 n=1 Tax=Drosophila simulans TaxID=7240 RepID=UPI00078AE082|nr:uncharacterized protein LOC27208581 [Drosophila simulans]KMZ10497.1 uncharacterized protein Dsimw501_GD28736 [Drosophila simulans]
MFVIPFKKRPSRQFPLYQLPRGGPVLLVSHYKYKPAFRPNAKEPSTEAFDPVRITMKNAYNKLMGLLHHFNVVNSIVVGSQCRRNPFHLVVPMDMPYEDIETDMLEGIQGWSDIDVSDEPTEV